MTTDAIKAALAFNVNDEVRVKLTPHGLAILKEQHDALAAKVPSIGKFRPPETDADGWSRRQLWTLMSDFGEHVYNGCPMPFETVIEIPAEALAEHARQVAERVRAETLGQPYLIWSNEHRAWWRANSAGYTNNVRQAGVYSRAEAIAIARYGRDGWLGERAPDEIAIPQADVLAAWRAAGEEARPCPGS